MADCLKIADAANKGRLTDDELDEIITELNAEKKSGLLPVKLIKLNLLFLTRVC